MSKSKILLVAQPQWYLMLSGTNQVIKNVKGSQQCRKKIKSIVRYSKQLPIGAATEIKDAFIVTISIGTVRRRFGDHDLGALRTFKLVFDKMAQLFMVGRIDSYVWRKRIASISMTSSRIPAEIHNNVTYNGKRRRREYHGLGLIYVLLH